MAGYIGWVPGKDAPSQPAAPSDEDIRGLYEDLDFDPKAHENFGRHAGSVLGIVLSVHVRSQPVAGTCLLLCPTLGFWALPRLRLTLCMMFECHSGQCLYLPRPEACVLKGAGERSDPDIVRGRQSAGPG